MIFTVLGSGGFIGGHVARHLISRGHEVLTPARGREEGARGHVIYAIGIVGGAHDRAHEMREAHTDLPRRLLERGGLDSFLYLSSTRVYDSLTCDAHEDVALPLPAGIFAETKIAGEQAVLALGGRVARLSNVYGPGQKTTTFLGAVLNDAREKGAVEIGESPESSKDYISIAAVAGALEEIALKGRERVYNVASGRIVTHAQIAQALEARGARVRFKEGGATRTFPRIDVTRLEREFQFYAPGVLDEIGLYL
jgi:nucleoside-diphosphate-sugar epimerase